MSYTKYYVYKEQVSNDGGQTWEYTGNEKPDGEPIGHYETLEECEGIVPPTPPTPESQYLTFVAEIDGTFKFSGNTVQYSLDSGTTWTTLRSNVSSPTVQAGKEIWWKQTGLTPSSSMGIGRFSSTKTFEAKGNVMSLYYGDDFADKIDLTGKSNAFYRLFSGCTGLTSAENLVLPATTLSRGCYSKMFQGCESLASAPELPATILADSCYAYMFHDCESLTTAPELLATTMVQSCYSNMFNGCSGLTTAPELPATTLADNCYGGMFDGCSGLTTAPELPATTLASSCYKNMFMNCSRLTTAPELPATTLKAYCYQNMLGGTSLTTAPELPATTLAEYCYSGMFMGCPRLTTAPSVLPATTLAEYCYEYMLYNCPRLTTAPELPATTLVIRCYDNMFSYCTRLNYIKCLATNISASNCTNRWVEYVASSGTFVTPSSTSWATGIHGIPQGWTRVNA